MYDAPRIREPVALRNLPYTRSRISSRFSWRDHPPISCSQQIGGGAERRRRHRARQGDSRRARLGVFRQRHSATPRARNVQTSAGIKLNHIPYPAAARRSRSHRRAGEVFFLNAAASIGHVQAGTINARAYRPRQARALPRAGACGNAYRIRSLRVAGLFVPASTPPDRCKSSCRLNAVLRQPTSSSVSSASTSNSARIRPRSFAPSVAAEIENGGKCAEPISGWDSCLPTAGRPAVAKRQ